MTRNRLALLAILTTIPFLYLVSCVLILNRLDEKLLITQFIAEPNSSASPVLFPIFRFVTDGYWKFKGHQKVISKNLESQGEY